MLGNNNNTLTAYNKQGRNAQGTLVGNWWEERELMEATGIARLDEQKHITKNRKDLFLKRPDENKHIYEKNKQLETGERILGAKYNEFPNSENYSTYGKGQNKAEQLRKVGSKTEARELFFKQQIMHELEEKEDQERQEANQRYFETTTRAEFYKKDPFEAGNTLGKRVMKTQDGKPLADDNRDYDTLADLGIVQRQQFLTDEQLREFLPKGESYITQQPITFWTEKLNDGAYYMSKASQQNTKTCFNKNNEFLKTYHDYTHVKK